MTEAELKGEAGYKIDDIYKEKGNLVVEVEPPTPDLKTEVFRFGPETSETKIYVEDGEIKENPKWKIRLKQKLRERIEREKDAEKEDSDFSQHKGERIKV